MVEILAVVVPVAMASLGAFVHMQVKTAAASQAIIGLKELINERFNHVETKLEESERRLDRIERSMNGYLIRD